MKHREIDILTELIRNLRPMQCLEWGAGYSTLYFPGLLPSAGRWTSVEHVEKWVETIRKGRPDPKAEILYIAPEHERWTDEHGDGAYEDLRSYVDAADRLALLDLILVDGRARNACLRKAATRLAPRGIVILHDANRDMYREPQSLFEHRLLFVDHRTRSGGLFLGGHDRDPRELVDADRHLAIWDAYRRMERF